MIHLLNDERAAFADSARILRDVVAKHRMEVGAPVFTALTTIEGEIDRLRLMVENSGGGRTP